MGRLGNNPDGFCQNFEKGQEPIRTKLTKFLKRLAPSIWMEILYHCVARYGVRTYTSWPGPAPVVAVRLSVLFFFKISSALMFGIECFMYFCHGKFN